MKKMWKLLALAGCLLALGCSGTALAAGENGWDAAKEHYYKDGEMLTGLQKIGKNYYFFSKKGVVQKNKFKKNLKVNGKKYTFYFGKNGKAYKANANKYVVAFKNYKINGKWYAFDEDAHMVTGVWATAQGKAFVYTKKGVYDSSATAKLRKATKSRKQGTGLLKQVTSLMGKPKKTTKTDSCNPFLNEYSGESDFKDYTDYKLFYAHVTVELTKHEPTGTYCMMGIYPLDK